MPSSFHCTNPWILLPAEPLPTALPQVIPLHPLPHALLFPPLHLGVPSVKVTGDTRVKHQASCYPSLSQQPDLTCRSTPSQDPHLSSHTHSLPPTSPPWVLRSIPGSVYLCPHSSGLSTLSSSMAPTLSRALAQPSSHRVHPEMPSPSPWFPL